ncbi:pleckstrin homology domain-containing family B member 2-like [Ostrea edulis]|uniref:pleckstrin homology domain-containing family B member 2-like n=1 Tax=Ostrea edulis TaxID=37623 RepID=UPI0024AF0DED|nr:pleckstrin homology domain-containing family B member 2-like [Ostrea edulis]
MSVVKAGYLKRFSKSLLHGGWRDTWAVLYDNSDLCLHKHQHDSNLKARIHLRDVCKRFAYGQYTNTFPDRPHLPGGTSYDSLLAIPQKNNSRCKVFWLLCHDPNELQEWMSAICQTLPSSPSSQWQQSNALPPYSEDASRGIGFGGVSGGYHGGRDPYPQQPGLSGVGHSPQGYPQQPNQPYPQYQQQPHGYAPQQEQKKRKGMLGGLMGGKAGKMAAGLLGGAALGYGASKILGHGFGGWGLGRHGSWGSISSYGSAGSFGSFD